MSFLRIFKPIAQLRSYTAYRIERWRLKRLMERGLKVGKSCYIAPDVDFDYGYPFLIEIGDNCRISKGVRILAHDATTFRDLGITRLAPVRILEGTFIGEQALIMPGVTIGPRALIGAGSFVNRDIGEDMAAAGNPARPYGKYSDLLDRSAQKARTSPMFLKSECEDGSITDDDLAASLQEASSAFVRGVPKSDPYYIHADYEVVRADAERAFSARFASSPPEPADTDEEDN